MTSQTSSPPTGIGPQSSLRRLRRPNLFFGLPDLIASLAALAVKRLRHHAGLSLLALLGIILAVGLVTSAAFFAQAVDQVVMRRELTEYSQIVKRPPFSTRVFTFSSREVPLSLARAEILGQNVAETLSAEVGLPVKNRWLLFDSGVIKLLPDANSTRYAPGRDLSDVHIYYIDEVEAHLDLTSGDFLSEGGSGETVGVLIHASLAEKIGAQVGEKFNLVVTRGNNETVPVQLRGFWQGKADDPFWFNDPNTTLQDGLLVRREDYLSRFDPIIPSQGRSASWHIVLDEDKVIPAEARNYAEGFSRGEIIIKKYLPDARLIAPSLSLEKFVRRQTTLTTLLLGFNIPAFGFLLYFLILTSVVIAYWQRRETAILVSRGMSISSVLGFTLVEEVLLFIIGSPLGLVFGVILARLMGDTVSFLSFDPRPPLPVSVRGFSPPLMLITLGVVLIARLWPAALAARQTVIEQQREHARPMGSPFWYRNFLDLLLLIPTAYAYRQLSDRGTIGLLVRDRPEDLYQDPLLVLVPALFIVTASLLTMRLFPLLMRFFDRLAGLIPAITPYLALRQLGRQGQTYINPLLLVIVCLALGVYTLSMAASLDQWLVDRIYYSTGADLTFEPYLGDEGLSQSVGAEWIPPTGDLENIAGVVKAARVGDYIADIKLPTGDGSVESRFLAIDRIEFPRVAWFRSDLASEPLGSLMNRLATSPDSILVPQDFLAQNQLRIGDQVSILVLPDFGARVNTTFTIAGTYGYFPTVYENDVVVIGNLDYIFSFFGVTMPHRLWLQTEPGSDGKAILEDVRKFGIATINVQDARATITEQEAEMERVGVFGTLSISFLAAAVMAAMGLLTYSYASLQERLYHFSMLRAVGMRQGQIIGQVFLEYAILTTYGAVAGVLIGSWAAGYFVPLFKVTGEAGVPRPPLIPIIAQDRIALLAIIFAGLMVVLELVIIALALRRRLFVMLRLGHQG